MKSASKCSNGAVLFEFNVQFTAGLKWNKFFLVSDQIWICRIWEVVAESNWLNQRNVFCLFPSRFLAMPLVFWARFSWSPPLVNLFRCGAEWTGSSFLLAEVGLVFPYLEPAGDYFMETLGVQRTWSVADIRTAGRWFPSCLTCRRWRPRLSSSSPSDASGN